MDSLRTCSRIFFWTSRIKALLGSEYRSLDKLSGSIKRAIELVSKSTALAACLVLLFFGNGMIEKVSKVPVGLQDLFSYVGSIMMVVGGIGLVLILPHMIYRQYKNKAK